MNGAFYEYGAGRRRRAWTVREKLDALDYLESVGNNKKRAASDLGLPCAKMLRDWKKAETQLRALEHEQIGMQRIRKPNTRRRDVRAALAMKARIDARRDGETKASSATCESAASELLVKVVVNGTNKTVHDEHTRSLSGLDCHAPVILQLLRAGSSSAAPPMASTRDARRCTDTEPADGGDGAVYSGSAAPSSAALFKHAIPQAGLDAAVSSWLLEDCPTFDYAAAVVGDRPCTAVLYAKSSGMIAGRLFFEAVMHRVGCTTTWESGIDDGVTVEVETAEKCRVEIGRVRGPVSRILQGERVALNALAECSGIATTASSVVAVARSAEWPGRIAGTRKTTPGFRLLQKYGMMVGGMDTHRMDLSSMIMLKDNHIAAAGSIRGAIEAARAVGGFSLKIDVECGTADQAMEACSARADVVMLDNFGPDDFKACARDVRSRYPNVIIEGSGGLTPDTIRDYFTADADVLSFSINRYSHPLDMSLKIVNEPA